MGHALAAADGSFDGQVEQVSASFSSEDLGPGWHTVYVRGQDAAGHWGPISAGLVAIKPWHNASNPYDVDGSDDVQASDVLVLVNSINADGARFLPAPDPESGCPPPFLDVTGDDWLTPEDVLWVINQMNVMGAIAVLAGEGEMAPAPAVCSTAGPSPRSPAEPDVSAVDTVTATLVDAPVRRVGTVAAASEPKFERPSGEWADVLTAEAEAWIGWTRGL